MLPPEVTAWDTAPFRVFCEQSREGIGVALVERVGCGAELVDQAASMPAGCGESLARWGDQLSARTSAKMAFASLVASGTFRQMAVSSG